MYKSFRMVSALAFAVCLVWLAACDSDNNGGGGATATTGYTQADLAGRWNFVITGIATVKGYMVIDANGKVTEAVNKTGVWELGKGTLTVSADGKVRGDFVWRLNWSPPAGSYNLWVRGFRLQFVSATKIDGAYAIVEVSYPGGVFLARVPAGTRSITLQKQ